MRVQGSGEILVGERAAVYRFATGTVPFREVSRLNLHRFESSTLTRIGENHTMKPSMILCTGLPL